MVRTCEIKQRLNSSAGWLNDSPNLQKVIEIIRDFSHFSIGSLCKIWPAKLVDGQG